MCGRYLRWSPLPRSPPRVALEKRPSWRGFAGQRKSPFIRPKGTAPPPPAPYAAGVLQVTLGRLPASLPARAAASASPILSPSRGWTGSMSSGLTLDRRCIAAAAGDDLAGDGGRRVRPRTAGYGISEGAEIPRDENRGRRARKSRTLTPAPAPRREAPSRAPPGSGLTPSVTRLSSAAPTAPPPDTLRPGPPAAPADARA